jgi:hypothetical protein
MNAPDRTVAFVATAAQLPPSSTLRNRPRGTGVCGLDHGAVFVSPVGARQRVTFFIDQQNNTRKETCAVCMARCEHVYFSL